MTFVWRLFALGLMMAGWALPAVAVQWANVATVSSTMGLTQNAMCVGGADSTDVGCPLWAPILSTNGDVSASGVVRATQFIGDGSGLTGVVASTGDRIVSGTTSMVAYTATGLISVTQAGVNTAYFHPSLGLVTVGVSSTGGISGTTGYFSGNVGVGTSSPIEKLTLANGNLLFSKGYGASWGDNNNQIRIEDSPWWLPSYANVLTFQLYNGTSNSGAFVFRGGSGSNIMTVLPTGMIGIEVSTPTTALEVSGTVSATHFVGDGSGLTNIPASAVSGLSTDRITSGTTAVVANTDGYISLTTGGTTTGYLDTVGRLVVPGVSSTAGISGTTGYFSGNVGVGTTAPSYKLDVAGDIAIENTGTLRFATALGGDSNWTLGYQTGPAASVFGTAASVVQTIYNGASYSYLLRNTSNVGLFEVKGSNGQAYFAGNVGIGTTEPSATLHVSGGRILLDNGQHFASKDEAGVVRDMLGTNGDGSVSLLGFHGRNALYSGDGATYVYPSDNVGTPVLNVYATNRLGVGGGYAVPVATLDVSGSLKVAGDGTETCGASTVGSLRRNPSTGRMQICQ